MSSNSFLPTPLQKIVTALNRLPGIGRKTAERLAVAMLDWPDDTLRNFGDEILHLKERVKPCPVCGNFTEGDGLCRICRAPDRQRELLCIVEQATQIAILENACCFKGLYHVLGGKLSPLNGKGPESLRLQELRQRLDSEDISELIIATSSDVEGEATAHFLAAEFAKPNLAITRLAAGLPVGSDLSYADGATIALAINGRHKL